MYPSSFSIRAISAFNLDAGTSTFGWRALMALRTRVSMSPMGSLVMLLLPLPARLDHARDLPVQRELAETQAAHAEFAQVATRPPAPPATVALPATQFGLAGLFGLAQSDVLGDLGSRSHVSLLFSSIAGTASPGSAAARVPRRRSSPRS